jgi:hypothetical protein
MNHKIHITMIITITCLYIQEYISTRDDYRNLSIRKHLQALTFLREGSLSDNQTVWENVRSHSKILPEKHDAPAQRKQTPLPLPHRRSTINEKGLCSQHSHFSVSAITKSLFSHPSAFSEQSNKITRSCTTLTSSQVSDTSIA